MPGDQPKVVQVPNFGNIQFPASMADSDIEAAIRQNYAPNPKDAGYKPTVFTDDKGNAVSVPHSQTQDAMKKGWRVGPPEAQKLGGKSNSYDQSPTWTANAPAQNIALGVASGAGIPESNTPVRDLAKAIFDPPNIASGVNLNDPGPLTAEELQRVKDTPDSRGWFARLIGAAKPLAPDLEKKIQAHGAAGMVEAYKNNVAGIPIVSQAIVSSAGQLDKAKEAWDAGSPTSAAIRAGSAFVPIVGPAAENAGEEMGQGLEEKDADKVLHGLASGAGQVATLGLIRRGQQKAAARSTNAPAQITVSTSRNPITNAVSKAMAKKPLPQQTGAGTATNADIADYAQSKGINLTPGQMTDSRPLQAIQAVGERGLVGNSELLNQLDTNKANFANLVDDYRGRVGNSVTTDPETVGAHLQQQANGKLAALKQSAQNDFQSFTRKTGNISVDLSDVKSKYSQQLADQTEALKNLPAKYATPIRNALQKLSNIEGGSATADPKALADLNKAAADYGLSPGQVEQLRAKMGLPSTVNPGQVSMSTAQQLRSAYSDMARDYSGNIPKQVQRIAAQASSDIDAAMAKAADKAGATQTWRNANSEWSQLQKVYNNSDSPISRIVSESDPQKVTSSLLQKGQYGGNTGVLKQLKQNGFDVSPLKSQVIQDIADNNFKLSQGGRGLGGYSSDFLGSLFEPAELSELQNMGQIARKIKFEMNPSGTSNVTSAEHQLGAIARLSARAPLVPAAAARVSTSPALMRIIRGQSISPQVTANPQINTAVPPALLQLMRGSGIQKNTP